MRTSIASPNFKNFIKKYTGILTVVFALAAFSLAQETVTLSGTVADSAGAIIPGATVKAVSIATGAERTVVTTDDGFYTIPQLRAGMYRIVVTNQGFKTAQVNDIELAVGQARSLDIALETGELSVTVDVLTGDTLATVDTSSNRLGANISAREVEELPVNGRNYSQLYLNAPGATNTGSGNFNELRFNGRANQQNQTKLDGIEATAIFDGSPGYVTVQGSQFRLQTSLENIQEFRVDSSNYPAESGTGTGGQINVIGKSGSNQYNGSLFYYIRNDALDARNFFDGAEASPLKLNQFGGSFGGPIVKNKLFFFGSYEGLRQRAGFNIIESTPSTYVRDFIGLYDGVNTTGNTARDQLGITVADANAAVTSGRLAALRATGMINAFPLGSGAFFGAGGLLNSAQIIQVNRTAKLDENALSFRFDYKHSDSLTFYGRYQRTTGTLLSPDGASGRFVSAEQKPDNFVFSATKIIGANMVNEAKFGINRAPTDLTTVVPDVTGLNGIDLSLTSLRLTGTITSPGINGGAATGFTEPGGLTRQSSAANGRAQPIRPTSYSFIDNFSWTKGNHNFKFGGEVRMIQVDFDQLGGITYSYGNLADFVLNRNLTAAFTGDLSLAGDFSVATDPISTIARPQSGMARGRQYYLIGYGQDEWRVNPEMTLSYGLRWEYYSPNREKDDRQVVFNAATGKLEPNNTTLYVTRASNLAPRLGFTWKPKFLGDKTVIRLGGGLYFGPGQYEDLIQPIESNVFRSSQTIAAGITTGTSTAVSTIGGIQSGFTPRAYDTNGYVVPERVGQYGVSVQQELPGNTVLTVGYVGSQGRNLFLRSVTNRLLPGSTMILDGTALPSGFGVINRCSVAPTAGQCVGGVINGVTQVREFDIVGRALSGGAIVNNPLNVLKPFGEIDYKTSGGRDRYDALQILVNRRFAKGLTLNAQYQLGKTFGNTQGSNEAATAQNPYSFDEEFGPNTFDIRHSANITALYELPLGKGQMFNLDGVADAVLGGWQLGATYNGRSGTPINVLISRPDVVATCQLAVGCSIARPANQGGGTVIVAQGFVIPLPSGALPTGFAAVINTPGGNASRSTRRPDLIAGVNPYTVSGGLLFLNPAAFAMPAPGTYGNLERNALKGPTFNQFDLTFQKRFRITEDVNLVFRSEIYNIFNQANFSNPPSSLPNNLVANSTSQQPGTPFSTSNVGSFGVINGTVGRTVGLGTNRQIQFAVRLNF